MGKAYLAKLSRWGGLVVLVIALGLPAFAAQAGELAVTGQNIQSKSESSWIQIGEDKGHGIGAYESMGITYHGDGKISTYVNKGTYDWNNAAGKSQGYILRTFEDGSTYKAQYQGQSKLDGKVTIWSGTWTILGGTGKYEGVKGEGTYQGRRYGNGMSVSDWEGTEVLPD